MNSKYITNFSRDDGFGAQYQTILYSIIYAELIKKEFVYTPFIKMEHNYNNDTCFLQDKEKLINIIGNYKTINQVDSYETTDHSIYKIVESNLDEYVNLKSFIKVKDLFNENKPLKFKLDSNTVAVHIRRKNIHDNGQDYGYTDDDYFLNIINHIRKSSNNKNIFHIYSQGDINCFENFKSDDTYFHLNEKLEDTIYGLTSANTLIMSKSSLSYISALMTEGMVYYIPFWHPKLNKWKIL